MIAIVQTIEFCTCHVGITVRGVKKSIQENIIYSILIGRWAVRRSGVTITCHYTLLRVESVVWPGDKTEQLIAPAAGCYRLLNYKVDRM